MTWTLVRGETRTCNTYGVEVETEFEGGGCPIQRDGYHDHVEHCDERFFDNWRIEDDCSLRGGAEVITPVMYNASGMAEIIATFSILKDLGARMTRRCGQHTSVMTNNGDRYEQIAAVRVTAALEDAMLALTGSLARFAGDNRYAPKIKNAGRHFMDNDDDYYGNGGSANPRGDGRIEFRYPPGTLQASQMAMNVGICQLVVKKACEMTLDEASDMAREALSIGGYDNVGHGHSPNGEQTHELVKHGLGILADWGWNFTGNFPGLPYHPDDTPQYVTNHLGGFDVRLPGRRRISARMNRQINAFYRKLATHGRFDVGEDEAVDMAEEAIGILSAREEALLA